MGCRSPRSVPLSQPQLSAALTALFISSFQGPSLSRVSSRTAWTVRYPHDAATRHSPQAPCSTRRVLCVRPEDGPHVLHARPHDLLTHCTRTRVIALGWALPLPTEYSSFVKQVVNKSPIPVGTLSTSQDFHWYMPSIRPCKATDCYASDRCFACLTCARGAGCGF